MVEWSCGIPTQDSPIAQLAEVRQSPAPRSLHGGDSLGARLVGRGVHGESTAGGDGADGEERESSDVGCLHRGG